MKKLTAFLLGLVMVLSLAACSSENSPAADTPNSSSQENSTATSGESSDETSAQTDSSAAGAGNTLVVYFSATGNTEEAAGYIAEITGGDLLELEPADPYTDEDLNYNNDDSRVSREHEDASLRDVELVADTVENWDDYDTVFIGYPIWWGIAAWPVDTFIEANDFTDKTVIPFCTSASSGLGDSGELLAEMAGTGNWLEGHRFSSRVSRDDVQTWLDELHLS
ncbi:MAG: flavodoxin [Clostridiales bacterium]|nr:flavodoxin [Clostridiales bacterium]